MIIDFDKVKALLDLKKTESDYPDLEVIGTGVVAAIEVYLQRWLETGNYEETMLAQSDSTRMIPLKALPVASIASVTVNGAATTNYFQTPYGLRLGEPVKESAVTVNYSGGYEALPADLEKAILTQVCYEYQQKNSIGIELVSTDGGTTKKSIDALLPAVIQMLQPYRHPFRSL